MCELREGVQSEAQDSLSADEGRRPPAPISRAQAFFISIGIHFVLLWIAAWIIFSMAVKREQPALVCQREMKEECFYDEPENTFVRRPRADDTSTRRPFINIEEEVEITKDVPDGIDFDCLSNKNLGGDSCVDAYAIGPGSCGPYGYRPPNKVLGENCDGGPG